MRTLSNIRATFAILIIFSFLIVISCRKEQPKKNPDNLLGADLVVKVNTWLTGKETTAAKEQSTKIRALHDNLEYSSLKIEKLVDSEWLIIIPISTRYKQAIPNNIRSNDYLILLTDGNYQIKKGNILQYAAEGAPAELNAEIFKQLYHHGNLAFSGTMTFLSVDANLLCNLRFENGKLTSSGFAGQKTKRKDNTQNQLANSQCYDVWYVIYYANGSSEWQYLYSFCDGDESPCLSSSFSDNGTVYNVGCGSGGNGGDVPIIPEIYNNVQNPCIRNNVNNAISKDCKNKITSFINTVFGNNDNYDIQFNDFNFVGADSTIDAKTTTGPNPSLTYMITNVRLNTSMLADASQEYIAATIIHECLHAWIDYKFPVQMDALVQHGLMADSYRFTLMKNALTEMFPNMSAQDAADLTWGGLMGTLAFSQLPATEQSRILQKNLDYRNHISGTPCTP